MSRWFAGFCFAVSAGVAIAIAIAIAQLPASAGGFWLAILWGAWIVAVAWALTRPSFSLLFAAIAAAMLLFVIIPATGAQLFGDTTIGGNDYSSGVDRALEIAALAQCGMLAGAMAARTFWPVGRLGRLSVRLSPSRLDRSARWSVAVGIGAVIAFSVLGGANLRNFFVYTSSGGYGTFASEASGNLGYLLALQCVAGMALVLLPLRLGSTDSSRWRGPLFTAALAIFVLLGGGQRVRFFIPAFAASLVWLKTSKRRLPPRRVAAIGLLVMVVISGLVGIGRGAAGSRHFTVKSIVAAPFGTGNDLFLPLAGLASTIPGRLPYLDGTSYLQIVVFPIPRALWSGKPQDVMTSVQQVIDPGNSGFAFPEFGEMYANFGLPGVMVGSLMFGALAEFLYIRFTRSESVRESVFIAICGAILLALFTRNAIAPMLTAFGGLVLAAGLVCRRRSPVLAAAAARAPSEDRGPGKTRWPVATG